MMRQMYLACADALTLGSRLHSAPNLPPAGVLRQRIAILLEEMARRAQHSAIGEQDVDDARYAIVAFLDEQILSSQWTGRNEWMLEPLQFIHYNENTAGEGFFQRLDRIRQQPERAHVLQIYHLCLSLGFMGRYAVRGHAEALAVLAQSVRQQLWASLPYGEALSPRGEPSRPRLSGARRNVPIVAVGIGLVGLAVVVYLVLNVVLVGRTADAVRETQELVPATPWPSGAPPG